jgi:hypothetical protein
MSRSFLAKPLTTKLFLMKFAGDVLKSPDARGGVFISVLLAALMSGCAVQETPKMPVVVPVTLAPKPVALTVEADAALKAAEQSVTEARIKRALWTAAVEELKRAQAAAKNFDSVATLVHASETIALCGLSVAQLSKAPVKW